MSMKIKYVGTGDSPRSFIEELQRYAAVGEEVVVKAAVGERLLATGRWRRAEKVSRAKGGSKRKKKGAVPVVREKEEKRWDFTTEDTEDAEEKK